MEGGPPRFSQSSTSSDLLDHCRSLDTYRTVTFCGRPFQTIWLGSRQRMALSHGLVRFRSPLLTESRLISFPPGTEMFQFPGFAPDGLCIQPPVTPSGCPVRPGCPIRRSPDQSAFDHSPELIAAYNVLHRLCTPRHPPCTLSSLTTFMNSCDQTVSITRIHLCTCQRSGPTHQPGSSSERIPGTSGRTQVLYQRARLSSSGADRDRTGNLRVANAALSRLSYGPGKADQGTPSRSPEYLTTRPPESRTKSRKPAGRRKSPRVANPTSGVHSTLPCCRLKRSNGPDRVRTCDLILIRDAL